jgi:hypothetical protein
VADPERHVAQPRGDGGGDAVDVVLVLVDRRAQPVAHRLDEGGELVGEALARLGERHDVGLLGADEVGERLGVGPALVDVEREHLERGARGRHRVGEHPGSHHARADEQYRPRARP